MLKNFPKIVLTSESIQILTFFQGLIQYEICVDTFLAHLVGPSLPLISYLPKSSSQDLMAPKKIAINKHATKPAVANPVIYLGASPTLSTDVSTHSYNIKSKTKALADTQPETLSMFSNSLYNTSSPNLNYPNLVHGVKLSHLDLLIPLFSF